MKPTPWWTALLIAAVVALALISTLFAALQGDPLKLGLSTPSTLASIAGKASNSMLPSSTATRLPVLRPSRRETPGEDRPLTSA